VAPPLPARRPPAQTTQPASLTPTPTKPRQTKEDQIYGVFAEGSSDEESDRRRGKRERAAADYTKPVGFVSSGTFVQDPDAPKDGGAKKAAGAGAGAGSEPGGRPGLGAAGARPGLGTGDGGGGAGASYLPPKAPGRRGGGGDEEDDDERHGGLGFGGGGGGLGFGGGGGGGGGGLGFRSAGGGGGGGRRGRDDEEDEEAMEDNVLPTEFGRRWGDRVVLGGGWRVWWSGAGAQHRLAAAAP
jgi:hypothetical protein